MLVMQTGVGEQSREMTFILFELSVWAVTRCERLFFHNMATPALPGSLTSFGSKDEFITQKLILKHTQTFRPCHTVFYDGSGLSHDRRVM